MVGDIFPRFASYAESYADDRFCTPGLGCRISDMKLSASSAESYADDRLYAGARMTHKWYEGINRCLGESRPTVKGWHGLEINLGRKAERSILRFLLSCSVMFAV